MRIVVTRPEEDAGPLRAKLEALGHEVILAPLLVIVPRVDVRIETLPYQAAVATSANAIRSLTGHVEVKSLRILTVGPQSLSAARQAGFTHAEAHGGDVNGLARHMRQTMRTGDGPIVYLSGAETSGDLAGQLTTAGFDWRRVVLYDAVAATGLGQAATALTSADAVMLYSPRTARIWCGLVAEAAAPHYLCLSGNVAVVLPATWKSHIAAAPEESAMLALLEQIQRTR